MSAPAMLEGVRVVDFTQALSGPYCTLMLADLGAEVVKVESPTGDDSRRWGPPHVDGDATYFLSVNRNKRSAALDLKAPDGLAAALRLIAGADVVVENWRPGVAARLGLDAEGLRAAHPGLVHCSISGFGQDRGTRSGYDQIVQGTSGAMSLTGPPGDPTKWGVPVGDIAAGMFAATAIVSALYERRATGRGRAIDVAMQDCLVSMLTHQAARYLNGGPRPVSEHNGHVSIAPYGLFPTSDGFVNICVGNDAQFRRMCAALGCAELGDDARFATNSERLTHRPALSAALHDVLSRLGVEEVLTALEAAGVPAGRVRDVDDVLDDPATAERGMIAQFDRPDASTVRVVNTPWKFDGAAPSTRRPAPRLGEHTAEVLAESPPTPTPTPTPTQ